jgi:hypothetical protein
MQFDNEPAASDEYSDELLTIDELAAILKVPRSWIYFHTRKRSENGNSTREDRQVPPFFRSRRDAIPESASASLTVLMRVVHWSAQEN